VPKIDLHCHTTASDGTATPTELVRQASARGVGVIAVTDHDTIAGVAEARRAAEDEGVRVIAGIELSTRHGGRELHVLGYFVDTGAPTLTEAVERMRRQRRERAQRIVQRLRELGYEMTMGDVEAQAAGDVVARPHIARALVERGYLRSARDAFTSELLADEGRAWVPRETISTVEAVDLIRSAGGVAVLAHPGVVHHEGEPSPPAESVVAELAGAGLAGLEVDHPDHPPPIRDRLAELARRYRLVPTGGSDWHGFPARTLGSWTTSASSLRRLEELAATAGG
jgi:predicted metal-dependent phosphoesterase TrpH